ncbi:MAG: HU family DNA-binding protein [Bradymonadaceae bacterium]
MGPDSAGGRRPRLHGATTLSCRRRYRFLTVHLRPNPVMTKTELVEAVSENADITKKRARKVVNGFFDAMKRALMDDRRIELRGFGSFTIRNYDAREARNPKTGEVVHVEPKKSVHFNVGKDLKQRVDTLNEYDD